MASMRRSGENSVINRFFFPDSKTRKCSNVKRGGYCGFI
ncbi:hypothetical protein BRARA_I01054 [Brassica rapa]|uniref:Uncharacterized protein n=1 Tax=Brassica campestris TaxID=3711 RepID=A0A397XSP5_BRACM|nr:hypothetical protein BRARA_I01054 [Brassica rapa]